MAGLHDVSAGSLPRPLRIAARDGIDNHAMLGRRIAAEMVGAAIGVHRTERKPHITITQR